MKLPRRKFSPSARGNAASPAYRGLELSIVTPLRARLSPELVGDLQPAGCGMSPHPQMLRYARKYDHVHSEQLLHCHFKIGDNINYNLSVLAVVGRLQSIVNVAA